MNGIININKPIGITSHDVVYRLRKILNIFILVVAKLDFN